MPSFTPRAKRYLRTGAVLMGAALLSFLVLRAGPDKLLENVKQIGWGVLLVLGLTGVSHVVKTFCLAAHPPRPVQEGFLLPHTGPATRI